MQIVELNINDLTPYEKNAKKHPEAQITHIANSLQEFGWKQPVVIDKNNVIVCGHGRVLAAKKLGWDKVPCIYADVIITRWEALTKEKAVLLNGEKGQTDN